MCENQCPFCHEEVAYSSKAMAHICHRHKHSPLKISSRSAWLWLSLGIDREEYQIIWDFIDGRIDGFECWLPHMSKPIISLDGGIEHLTPDNIADKLTPLLAFL
jgi:hypothetical protein